MTEYPLVFNGLSQGGRLFCNNYRLYIHSNYLSVFIKMKETQSHSGKDESDSTDNDSNPIEEDEIISKPKLLY